MADNENVNNNENTDVVEELQNSSLLNNGSLPDYVNFYRGTRADYEAKKEANQLDPNGMYFTIDEETGKRCIFIGNNKFSDIKSGWEDSIILSDEGVLQQVSKDSTDYNAHFQQLLDQLNNVPAQEDSTFPLTIEELEIPAEEEAILNEHAKTYRYLMTYETIADMRESRYLMTGMTAMVKGGQELNDGEADFYNIRFRVDGVDIDDGSTLIILDNENVAEKIDLNGSRYKANKNYAIGDVVYSNNKLYVCVVANGPSTSVRNLDNTSYWQEFKLSSSGGTGGVAVFDSNGRLVFPDGSLLWIE